jgi:LacI family transcriptional regulator
MKPTTTLKQLSEILQLSVSTVSRALKNHPDISAATRQKVQELSALLEYEPNSHAVSLRNQNTRLFGVILPSISTFFYHSFIAHLEQQARQHGYALLILQSGDSPSQEMENLRLCRANRVNGVFVSISPDTTDFEAFSKLESLGTPVIFVDKVPETGTFNRVCVADEAAAALAATTLMTQGAKDILAIFGHTNMSISRKRKEAFLQTCGKQVRVDARVAHNPEEASVLMLKAWQKKKQPDAVFCMSDEILSGVMKTIQQQKIQLYQDLNLIAISDGFIPKLYSPEIRYVETSGAQLADLAFNRMMSCLAGSTFIQELSLQAKLVHPSL